MSTFSERYGYVVKPLQLESMTIELRNRIWNIYRCEICNTSLESDLFYLLNSVNVRHNNAEQGGKNYIHFVADMKDGDIEQWYDDIYQMCLLAFLELDHLERKERVKKLKEDIQKNG